MRPDKYVKVKIEGKTSDIWEKLRDKFVDTIHDMLETVIDSESNTTVKEELVEFKTLLLNYGKNKLAKPGIDNAKTIAEIELLYTQKIKAVAEAKKLLAEADAISFETKLKKLHTSLVVMKALSSSTEDEDSLLISKEIDTLIFALNKVQELQ